MLELEAEVARLRAELAEAHRQYRRAVAIRQAAALFESRRRRPER